MGSWKMADRAGGVHVRHPIRTPQRYMTWSDIAARSLCSAMLQRGLPWLRCVGMAAWLCRVVDWCRVAVQASMEGQG
jgi:hypothetical protein